jgi:hypothetical protein
MRTAGIENASARGELPALHLAIRRQQITEQGGDKFDVINEDERVNSNCLMGTIYKKGHCAVIECAHPEMDLHHNCGTCNHFVHVHCMMQKDLLVSEEGGSDHHYCSIRCKR